MSGAGTRNQQLYKTALAFLVKYIMKSIYHGKAGANAKLKGKISKMLACRCCDLYNWKWSERIKEATKQIKEFKNGTID